MQLAIPRNLITAVCGITIGAAIAVAGFNGLPFILCTVLGAIVFTIFRISKRILNPAAEDVAMEQLIDEEDTEPETDRLWFIPIACIFLLMIPISMIWFGLGVVIRMLTDAVR